MLCDICHNKPAKIFYTEIINGEKKEQHLCEDCAGEYAAFALKDKLGNEIPISSILSGILANYAKGLASQSRPQPSCSRCGMTFDQFKKSGKFGCAECYNAFSMIIDKNLRNIQGADEHFGKEPINPIKLQLTSDMPGQQDVQPVSQATEGPLETVDASQTPPVTTKATLETARKHSSKKRGKAAESEKTVDSTSVEELRKLMAQAVAGEDYEEAARLRDMIHARESETKN